MASSSPPKAQSCPVCSASVSASPRYPNYLCGKCADKAVDASGKALDFFNQSMGGGFEARFKNDGSIAADVTENHIVYVEGTRVRADEAYFGGIVLVPSPETPGSR